MFNVSDLDPAGQRPRVGTGRVMAVALLGAAAVIAVVAVLSVRGDRPADSSVAVDAVNAGPTVAAMEVPSGPMLAEAPPILGVQEELTNIDGWLQSDIASLGELDGKVHIVQFWTFGCYNCKNTIPNLIHLNDTYGGDDFEIVGVHAPEFDYEKNPDAILEAAQSLGVTWPIALDTNKTNFRSWQESRRFWPRTYVIDQAGDIRFDRIGEGAYEQMEATVAWLLAEGADEARSAEQ